MLGANSGGEAAFLSNRRTERPIHLGVATAARENRDQMLGKFAKSFVR
jgi:hypothetical protein